MTDTPAGGPEAPEQPEQGRAADARTDTPAAPAAASPLTTAQAATDTPDPAAPTTTPTTTPTPKPDTRPRPAFGEYAPEGWEWKPEGDSASTAASASTARSGGAASGSTGAAPPSVHGVPHNLGAGTALPSRRGAGQSGSGTPYRAPAPGQPAPQPHEQFRAPVGGAPGYGQKPPNMGDRIVTILLLVFGGFGALYSAFALMGMSSMFVFLENAPGMTELTPPAWVDVTGKVTGIALLVLYGLVLVFSIRRLRARKLTFWAPLGAGILASIVVIVLIASAMFGTPELMQVMNDPQASADLLEYLQGSQPG